MLCGGCSAPDASKTAPAPPPRGSADKAQEAWRRNERIVRYALSGKPYSPEKFGDACAFFEEVTGITIRGNGSFFGWRVEEGSAADFKKVEAWYTQHRDQLYWDEKSQSVKVWGETRQKPTTTTSSQQRSSGNH